MKDRGRIGTFLAFCCLVGLLAVSTGCPVPVYRDPPVYDSPPWSAQGTFSSLYVLGHRFHTVNVNNGSGGDRCRLYLKVDFSSPAYAYHRFQAKVIMTDGSWVKSPVFINRSAGERTYRFQVDTSPSNCWGGTRHTVLKLRVAGCRNPGCVLQALD